MKAPDHRLTLSCALLAALNVLAHTASAHQAGEVKGKERCFGTAKPGQNHCANLSGTHDCAGRAKVDKSPDEWVYVAQGTCRRLGGFSEAEARSRLGLPKPKP